ncbi:unnamed protein product [Thlaspi arvense]|uniref:Uncharacterized protein n=1 Tax=Thlaspi arvense TaxID=13288 RepID=A0AAU9RRR1_THLAR|nr:unnamed protein product [Thlaspi arvense]
MLRTLYEIKYTFLGSSEAEFIKEVVKEVKRVIAAIGLEEKEENHFGGKGESLRIAFSMCVCFSIIIKCLDVNMNQRLSFMEILKRTEKNKESLPSDQCGLSNS